MDEHVSKCRVAGVITAMLCPNHTELRSFKGIDDVKREDMIGPTTGAPLTGWFAFRKGERMYAFIGIELGALAVLQLLGETGPEEDAWGVYFDDPDYHTTTETAARHRYGEMLAAIGACWLDNGEEQPGDIARLLPADVDFSVVP